MSGFTLSRRAERFVLVLLAVASALATAVVIGDASGDSDVRLAVLAAARGRALQSRAALVAALGARDRVTAAADRAAAPSVAADSGASSDTGDSSAGAGSSSSAGSDAASAPSSPAATAAVTPSTSPSASSTTTSSTPTATTPVATVSHLFQIVLTGTGYASSFDRGSSMPYLRSLVGRGTLLSGYDSLGDGPLVDELALVSGQAPNADTSSGCPNYSEFPTGTTATAAGLVHGAGCVYPETVLTLGDQISSAGHQWRAYIDGMGTRSCQHANSNSLDATVLPGSEPSYDTRANPFIYFHSLLDLGDCANDDLDLSHFRGGSGHSAPDYTYIAPSLCAEPAPSTPTTSGTVTTTSSAPPAGPATTQSSTVASTTTTGTTSSSSSASVTAGPAATPACPAGRPTGDTAQDAFLKAWVPKVLASAAYRDKGALLITFTAAADGHPVRTGALLLTSGSTHQRTLTARADPYTLLRATETALGLGLLGDAKHAAATDLFPSAHPSERTRSAGNQSNG